MTDTKDKTPSKRPITDGVCIHCNKTYTEHSPDHELEPDATCKGLRRLFQRSA